MNGHMNVKLLVYSRNAAVRLLYALIQFES
jgi:hypothetical protein